MSSNVKLDRKLSSVKQVWTSMEDFEEVPSISEDLPPSYALAVFRDCVDKIMSQENMNPERVVISQPSTSSTNLSSQSSLASTEFTLNPQKVETIRPISYAWSDKIVIKNIHERDRMTLLCFCASTLSALFTLTFYCTA